MPHEPPVTAAQRAYLHAFDQWLRVPSDITVRRRQQQLDAMCAEARIRPEGRPEQQEDTAVSADAPRPTKVVLADALAELQAREAKLKRLERELADARAAIKVLRKLVGDTPPETRPALTDVSQPGTDQDLDALVLRVIGEEQPCAARLLASKTALGPDALRATLTRLRDAGQVRTIGQAAGTRYLLPQSEAA